MMAFKRHARQFTGTIIHYHEFTSRFNLWGAYVRKELVSPWGRRSITDRHEGVA